MRAGGAAGEIARALLALALAPCCAIAAHATAICDAGHYGAKADGTTKDTLALQKAIDDCAGEGGGTVRLARGAFLSGPIVLKSHIALEIDAGATLLGSQDKADYPQIREMREDAVQPLISATDAQDVTIRGGGTIDGAGQPWWAAVYAHKDSPDYVAAKRPRLIFFDHSRQILIEGVTIRNSASWQVTLYYSGNVTIRNAKIVAPEHSPNTDGVDPFSSHHVTISHLTIDVGDDNVAIKSGQPGSIEPDDPSTDITVTDCTFLHGHGMSIGSEVSGGVQNVHVARVHFATGAKTAGFIVGLPESPITSIRLSHAHISAEKGMTISDATVTAHDFAVKAAGGPPFIMLKQASVRQQ